MPTERTFFTYVTDASIDDWMVSNIIASEKGKGDNPIVPAEVPAMKIVLTRRGIFAFMSTLWINPRRKNRTERLDLLVDQTPSPRCYTRRLPCLRRCLPLIVPTIRTVIGNIGLWVANRENILHIWGFFFFHQINHLFGFFLCQAIRHHIYTKDGSSTDFH